MDELQITARLKVHDGELARFRSLADACMDIVREQDTGTLQYDWFFDEEHNECVVRERYVDSDAVLAHIAHLGDTFGALLAISDFSAEVCGTPSEQLLQATKELDVKVYRPLQSL